MNDDVTLIISRIESGDAAAAEQLFPLVYDELRRLARARMAHERAEHTLQATALVHEAYLRLVGDANLHWDSRGHFFAAAAEAMRRILVEHARARNADKRGGNANRMALDHLPPIVASHPEPDDILDLDVALERFCLEDPGKAELVKLVYFVGMGLSEAAAVLGISRTTAHRHWVYARAWLRDAITGSARHD